MATSLQKLTDSNLTNQSRIKSSRAPEDGVTKCVPGSPSRSSKVEHKKFTIPGDQVILTGKSGGSIIREAHSFLSSEFKGTSAKGDCTTLGDNKRPQHRTIIVGSEKLIITGKKTSSLVDQVYELLDSHYNTKENLSSSTAIYVKVNPTFTQKEPVKERDQVTRVRSAFVDRDLNRFDGGASDLHRDKSRDGREENSAVSSQSDHVIQTKPVSERTTPTSKRYTPSKSRSYSSPAGADSSSVSQDRRRYQSPVLNKSLFSKAITDIHSQKKGCGMSPALSAHQLTYGASVSRSYTRSAVESVSAHQLMSPGDFCSKSAVDKDSDGAAEDSKQQTAGRDAANSPVCKDKTCTRLDISEGYTLAGPGSFSASVIETGGDSVTDSTTIDDHLSMLLGFRAGAMMEAPRLLPPSRFVYPPEECKTQDTMDKAVNTDQIDGDAAVISTLGDLNIVTEPAKSSDTSLSITDQVPSSDIAVTSDVIQQPKNSEEGNSKCKFYDRETLLELSSCESACTYPEMVISCTNAEILIKQTKEVHFDRKAHRLPHPHYVIMISHNGGSAGRRHFSEPQQRQNQRGRGFSNTTTTDPRSWGDSTDDKHGDKHAVKKNTSQSVSSGDKNKILYSESAYRCLEPIPETATFCSELDEVFSNESKVIPGVAFTKRPRDSYDDKYVKELLDYYEPYQN